MHYEDTAYYDDDRDIANAFASYFGFVYKASTEFDRHSEVGDCGLCDLRCGLQNNYERYFIPGILTMEDYQWAQMKYSSKLISDILTEYMIKHELKSWNLKEAEIHPYLNKSGAERALKVSLCGLLKSHLERAINTDFYFALAKVDLKQIAYEFVQENKTLLKFISDELFDVSDFVRKLFP
ncbi:hypothetical protein JTE90_029035 [Oedothorax gibbosus]|uniref:Uncharacterized protein n=1 Tax=Oedothorax gibbosus TaxID=931172 RepID=A0AAV6UKY0_9ARAC|nr:hypothetical protein JTE90_029035 [Oedothorax gibbosus]